jgi:hypothetical protein
LENFRLSVRARRRYIMQVAGLVLGVVGALDLAYANLKLFPFQMKDRGKGLEPHASTEIDQCYKIVTVTGMILIAVAFLLQLLSL